MGDCSAGGQLLRSKVTLTNYLRCYSFLLHTKGWYCWREWHKQTALALLSFSIYTTHNKSSWNEKPQSKNVDSSFSNEDYKIQLLIPVMSSCLAFAGKTKLTLDTCSRRLVFRHLILYLTVIREKCIIWSSCYQTLSVTMTAELWHTCTFQTTHQTHRCWCNWQIISNYKYI